LKRAYIGTAVAVLVVAAAIGLTQKHNLDAQHARETELRGAVNSIRHAIAAYHVKHQRNPASLNDLVSDGELRALPSDPITHSNTTWKTTVKENVSIDDFQSVTAKSAPTIVDVHSGASGNDSSGRPFADY
jgi:general secretion pathway protein G